MVLVCGFERERGTGSGVYSLGETDFQLFRFSKSDGSKRRLLGFSKM